MAVASDDPPGPTHEERSRVVDAVRFAVAAAENPHERGHARRRPAHHNKHLLGVVSSTPRF